MKRAFLLCLIVILPRIAAGQLFIVNPDTIYQAQDIILQNTDVYYDPFAPPDSTDTREALCNQSDVLLDSNGVGDRPRDYHPKTHAGYLNEWAPHGKRIGWTECWQRLFTARDKPVSTYPNRHSDIIVGKHVTDSIAQGEVIVSKNEDVDFRASGTIRMESGFHVMPGAFFHAYQEPKWGPTVFSDEFDSSSLNHHNWLVVNGHGDYGTGAQCSYDSNAYPVTDPDASDGNALDITLREDSCTCFESLDNHLDTCHGRPIAGSSNHFHFSSAILRSCPWPFLDRSAPLTSAYVHSPYGKYEFRDKIPHVLHHLNNWIDWYWSADLCEVYNGNMGLWHPNNNHSFRYGPYQGHFHKIGGNTYFISTAPKWSYINHPQVMFIDNFMYGVDFKDSAHTIDTLVPSWPQSIEQGGFPSYLADSTNDFTFYYDKNPTNLTEPISWSVDTAAGRWRKFKMAYRVDGANTYRFSKAYQPTSIKLITALDTIIHDTTIKTLRCHWEYNFNHPVDSGFLWLDDTMTTSDFHSFVGNIQYTVSEGFSPIPPVVMDKDTSWADTADVEAYAYTPYKYHTIGLEFLPHEVRILYDSNVIRRIPDRLVPKNSPYADWASSFPRVRPVLFPGELDIDYDKTDTLGQIPGTIGYKERKFFERHINDCAGCFPDKNGHQAAHHRLDYVKIWDVPADMKISDYKQ